MSPSVALHQRLNTAELDDGVESDTPPSAFVRPTEHLSYDSQQQQYHPHQLQRLQSSLPQSQQTYAPSLVSSSASSSPSSVFSADAASSQTSQSSSTSSSSLNALHVVWEDQNVVTLQRTDLPQFTQQCLDSSIFVSSNTCPGLKPSSSNQGATAIPCDQRLNPRRTKGTCSESGGPLSACSRAPPPLVRQSERKVNFVDNLVDSASQIVETIWPLSAPTCPKNGPINTKAVLSLRTFIQETLRRSRTSYSTLQVALYYLIVVKAHVPRFDFTMEQPEESRSFRALQCGRRMFLSALILASKYLQDHNYSARAWSKISGLSTHEINFNEMTFLSAIKWKLHIGESVFQRWTDIVLRYTNSLQPPTPPASPFTCGRRDPRNDWKSLIPHLTPDLDLIEMEAAHPSRISLKRPFEHIRTPSDCSSSVEAWRAEHKTQDQVLSPVGHPSRLAEARHRTSDTNGHALPPSLRLGSLPTPQMTPQPSQLNTPAAGVASFGSRRASICSAMAQAQDACTTRTTLAGWSNMKGASLRCKRLDRMRSNFTCTSDMATKVRMRPSLRSDVKENQPPVIRTAHIENHDLQNCVRGYLGL